MPAICSCAHLAPALLYSIGSAKHNILYVIVLFVLVFLFFYEESGCLIQLREKVFVVDRAVKVPHAQCTMPGV